MLLKNIHFIINPASGKEEPILSYIHKAFTGTNVKWQVSITHQEDDAYKIAKKLAGKTDLVVVYGGDGSLTKVAHALHGKATPMAIIPGGTANVLSKELGIPQASEEALAMIASGKCQVKKMDMGEANGCAFLLRINLGIMADMILDADKDLKSTIGQTAYGVSALKTMAASKKEKYRLFIDGEKIEEEGVSLTVTNAGNIGIGSMSFLPGISVADGLLDVILLRDADPLSVLKVVGSTLFQNESETLLHWRCRHINIKLKRSAAFICDDCRKDAKQIDIKIKPSALNILVPA